MMVDGAAVQCCEYQKLIVVDGFGRTSVRHEGVYDARKYTVIAHLLQLMIIENPNNANDNGQYFQH